MRPNQTYSFVGKLAVWPDMVSLVQCYQPIIGLQAFALYQYLCVTNDQGVGRFRFSQILNHLNFGTQALEQALDVLTAMKLLAIYQQEDNYTLALQAPQSSQDFLKNELYRALLAKKIGESAVEKLRISLPTADKNISKSFSEVFQLDGQIEPLRSKSERFDAHAFKQTMARHNLRFQDEQTDIIGLYHLAEQENWTWLEAYQLARETAINQEISIKRMQEKLRSNQRKSAGEVSFSPAEETIIRESQALSPLAFLTAIKDSKKAAVIASEKTCLTNLAKLGLLDEVINVIVLYTFNKVDSANLNEKYALKLGNDFSYKEIRSAEAAVLALREGNRKSTSKKAETSQSQHSNVPSWSNPDYKEETTEEDLARLEEIQRQILEKLDK